MGKEKTLPRLSEKQAGATAKFLRIPPRKARLVIDAVRGKYVSDALAVLKFVPNFAAEAISDVIKSAVANAENGRPHDEDSGRPLPALDTENLKLVRAFVDEGPRIKRLQPRAQGRGYRILKRMCHITVVVEEVEPKPRPQRPQRAARRTQPAAAARPASVVTAAKRPAAAVEAVEDAVEPEVTTVADAAVESAPIEQTTAAAEANQEETRDEIGAPITTETDVAVESVPGAEEAPVAAEAEKAE